MSDLVVIARGSVVEGLGHIVRAATVVAQLRTRLAVTFLIVGDEAAAHTGRGIVDVDAVLPTASGLWDIVTEEQPRLVALDCLDMDVPDDLQVAPCWVSLSPVFAAEEHLDAVVARSWTGGSVAVERTGPEYATIRPGLPRLTPSTYAATAYGADRHVGVLMGGGDAHNRTAATVAALKACESVDVLWVMLGEGYPHSYDALVDLMRGGNIGEVVLARTSRSMWSVLSRCSLAVVAGGISSYEAAYVGIPTLCLFRDERHQRIVGDLAESGAAESLREDHVGLESLADRVSALVSSPDRLFAMHRAATGHVDGRGAERVADALEELAAKA